MSRIGSLPVPVPASVNIELLGNGRVRVSGNGKQLEQDLPQAMIIELQDGVANVRRPGDSPAHRSLHGLTRTLLSNMVIGVSEGFTKSLEIQGVGYRAQKDGEVLALQLGFSHPVRVEPPAGISFEVDGPRVHVRGADKQQVGQVAADLRALRPPEPYKGKGVRYLGEQVRRKAGKAGKGGR